MPLTDYGEKAMLDWLLGGAAVTRPTSVFISFATGTPNDDGASDGPQLSRRTCSFAAANSPQGTATTLAAISCQATALATFRGFNLWDAPTGGNRLIWGTLSGTIGIASGGVMGCASGTLVITLA
jgi:hypothetical protein